MKRKRGGHKKGKPKKKEETDEYKDNSGMEVDTPSSDLANINPDGSKKSVGRVKVKLRTPNLLDSQPTSSDESSHQQDHAKLGAPSIRPGTGCIKIKSSKALGLNADKPFSVPKETNPRYNKHQLDTSLTIIRKVMKMEAAEPFNVPVNPQALGIPDYFDIIDTPMDFGTICSNLEKNDKYMNSEDVYRDVQYIWDNCYKYNNKGDYILDLMKRVKKNFMKYWAAAGLYSEPPKGAKGAEKTSEDIALSDGKAGKAAQLKQKKKKRHGRHHKHDCLCAICVLKRRRKEREREENAQITKGNFATGGDKHAKEFKQEEPMLVESPGGEDSSSNTDESLGSDGDAGVDKGEVAKMEISEKQRSPSEGKHETVDVDDDNDDEDNHDVEEDEEEEDEDEDEEEIEMDSQKREMDDTLKHGGTLAEKSNVGDATVLHDEYKTMQQEGQAAIVQQQKKHKDSQDKHQKAKLLESLCVENPKLSSLCGILFPNNSQSVWSGPHSLLHQRNSACASSIHAAIGTFME